MNKYKRLTPKEKRRILSLNKKGFGLRKIRDLTGINFTTIYYHTRKHNGKLLKDFKCDLKKDKVGELIGAFAGDGSYYLSRYGRSYHHIIRYAVSWNSELDYAKYLFKLLKLMNLNPFLIFNRYRSKPSWVDVKINSKPFSMFIKNYLAWNGKKTANVSLKYGIDHYYSDFLRGFARGLMDTDGFVEPYNVTFACISNKLSRNLADIFSKFNIKYNFTIIDRKSTGRRSLYKVRVLRESLHSYEKLVGFSNPYKRELFLNNLNGVTRI